MGFFRQVLLLSILLEMDSNIIDSLTRGLLALLENPAGPDEAALVGSKRVDSVDELSFDSHWEII